MLRTKNNSIHAIPNNDIVMINEAIELLNRDSLSYVHRASQNGGSYCIFRREGKLIASYDTLPTTEYILEQ
jgi:hypothetical protein